MNRSALPSPALSSRANLRGAELGLALLVLSVVAMMIVPLPTWLLDGLLATNLSLSVAVLLVVIYAPDALSIATFPTVLLLTTLFRLGLNVSSARLILLQANAGDVIGAFGHFVVRGNYVVGGVIFLVLTIIQFVVIAKGSERVAEVGARFVLDAMPGKQMAIDAELRAGSIDGAEARRRRRILARESQFYGAMDGAMKFVKGDVIAQVVITLVNLLGGLAIGVLQRGMPAVDALKRYGLLTIGDGLVSQIPALVLSTSAGVLVTRVASEDADTPLGQELARQLFGAPKALRIASAFVLLLALVPGLPTLPFLVVATLLFLAAQARSKHLEHAASGDPDAARESAVKGARRAELSFVPIVVPWSLELSRDAEPTSGDDASRTPVLTALRTSIADLREQLFDELGVPLPQARVRVAEGLPPRHAIVSLFEVPTRLVTWPETATAEDIVRRITEETVLVLRARASEFLGLTETQRLLDELEQLAPATVRTVTPKPVSLPLLADVLRRLLEERVSIRDLRAILESLAQLAGGEKDPLTLTELVRAHLRRPLTFKLTRGAPSLGVVLLDPAIEDTVRRAIQRTPTGSFLALAPAVSRDLLASLRRASDEASSDGSGPVVFLTQPDVRRFVRKLLESDLPDALVVNFAELLPEITLRPLARATLVGIG